MTLGERLPWAVLAGATLLPALACALPVPADRAARSVAASLVASAFFR